MRLRKHKPQPPQNVVAYLDDGTKIPLECTYEGIEDGTHTWVITTTLPELPRDVTIDVLPAHTSVVLRGLFVGDEDDQ